MNSFAQIFEHLPQHSIVVCKQCRLGLPKLHLKGHLTTHHKTLPCTLRKQLLAIAATVSPWAETEASVLFPAPASALIPHLAVFNDGYQCTAQHAAASPCLYICRTLRGIQAHCRTVHGWEKERTRGRPSTRAPQPPHASGPMWIEGVSCQKFQPTGCLGRLFSVQAREREDPEDPFDDDDDDDDDDDNQTAQDAVAAAFAQASAALKEAEKTTAEQIEADINRFVPNPWLNRVGWAKHLAGFDRAWLLQQVRKPERHEQALAMLCWAVETVIWKAQQASRASVVGYAAMNCINRREGGSTTNEKPFNARQTRKTMIQYTTQWVEIVRYIWRTHGLSTLQNDEAGRGQRPPYTLSAKQSMLLSKIQLALQTHLNSSDSDSNSDSDSDSDSDSSSDSERGADISEEEEQELEELALAWMLALLDHRIQDNEYRSALISGMAVLGLQHQSGWMSAVSYTPKIAAVVNIGRMLVLYHATQTRQKAIAENRAQGWSQDDAEEQAPSHFSLVQEMAHRFFTLMQYGGQPCPVDVLLRWKAYGMKIQFTTKSAGVVDWIGDTVLYGHMQFSMPQLRAMVHGLVATARLALLRDLLLLDVDDEGRPRAASSSSLPPIPWDRLVDNAAERRVGWSFLKDPRNQTGGLQHAPSWLSERVCREEPLRAAFLAVSQPARSTGVVWQTTRVQAYKKALKAFQKDLLVLVHLTGGMPARGTELITVQYKNSPNGDSRGVFLEDGLVACMTVYHKGIGLSGRGKTVHRYLPREVGELMVYYLWFVLPFWERLQSAAEGRTVPSSPFLWEPEPEQAWERPAKRKRDQDDGHARPASHQASAPAPAAGRLEIRWNSQRVSKTLQKAGLQAMGVKLGVAAWRHICKAIYRRYVQHTASVQAVLHDGGEDDDNAASDPGDELFDLQAGHGSYIAGIVYGRLIQESLYSTEAERRSFRRVSTEWHLFLQFQSTLEGQRRPETANRIARPEAMQEEDRRWRQMRSVDLNKQLRTLVGPQAQFRGVQKPALRAVFQQKSPIIAIMGTGAGKSLLFMLPASCSTGVTIVVVPLVSLRQDVKARCDQAQIECVEWNSAQPHEWAQIVLVTPEAAVGAAFGQFLTRQRSMGRLDRIVVDECHTVLDSVDGWRSRMLELRNLVCAETQLVYLTATLRPSEEAQFVDILRLPAKEQSYWFRGTTTRTNIRYQVSTYDLEKEDEAVQGLVEQLRQRHHGQILVYCDTVARTERLAGVLQCPCFHQKVGSSADKRRLVEQLTQGRQQVFVSTNALGLGIDAPTIRAVVHIGRLRTIRAYAQESGRAGRDGAPSEAIIMQEVRIDRYGRVQQPRIGNDVEQEMQELIGGSRCMRVVLDQAMDGRIDRTGCEEGEERCQRCAGQAESNAQEAAIAEGGVVEGGVVEGGVAETEQAAQGQCQRARLERKAQADIFRSEQASEVLAVEQFRGMMEEWKKGCQRCYAFREEYQSHRIQECTAEGAEDVRKGVAEFQGQIQWARFSGCFECGLPQDMCASWEANRKGGWQQVKEGCKNKGLLAWTVFSI